MSRLINTGRIFDFFGYLATGFNRSVFARLSLIKIDLLPQQKIRIGLVLGFSLFQSAQATETNITPTTGSGNLNTVVTPNGNNYEIRGGEQRGTNLFHSFQEFNVGAGDNGKFLNNTGRPVSNILSRVTGGNVSEINGGITTQAFPGANFYFINPAGIIFGADAALNIDGSFHISTADYLSLGDLENGVRFYADPFRQNLLLTTAAPSAFGFLQESPANITINGSALRGKPGQTISLTAGDINIQQGRLATPEGALILTSLASSGEVQVTTNASDPSIIGGDIRLTEKTQLSTSGGQGGQIVIRGGNLVIDQSTVISKSKAEQNGKNIDIALSGKLDVIKGSLIETSTHSTAQGGNIDIRVSELSLQGGQLNASTFAEGQGGEISIRADIVNLGADADGKASQISVLTNGSGNAGAISLNVDKLSVVDNSTIASISRGKSSGNAGTISVQAKQLILTGGGSINATSFGSGDSGDISITAEELIILQGVTENAIGSSVASGVYSDNKATGNGGQIVISTPDLLIEGGAIAARSSGDGDGGEITVFADHLILRADSVGHRANISVVSKGKSDVGSINIQSVDMDLNGSTISAANRSVLDSSDQSDETNSQLFERNGGNIKLTAGEFIHIFDSEISTKVGVGSGEGGNIDMGSKVIVMGSSRIIADAARGNGGNIQIVADAFFKTPDSLISATSELGIDGEIVVDSPITDIISSIQLLPADFWDVASILSTPCAQRSANDVSSLLIRRYEVLPDSPYALRTSWPGVQLPALQNMKSQLIDKGC